MKVKTVVIISLILFVALALSLKIFSGYAGKQTAVPVTSQTAAEQKTEAVKAPPEPVKAVVEEKKPEPLTVVAVGDILLGRGVGMRLDRQNKGYIYPFEKAAGLLKEGDVVFGNLEESITSSTHSLAGVADGGKYILKNDVKALEGIKYAGFNILNLANNHILDYYDRGLYDTLELLDKEKIAHSGAGKNLEEARKPALLEKKGMKVGILSYTDMAELVYKGNPPLKFAASEDRYGVAPIKYEYIEEDIGKLRKDTDLLIISLHWGQEESFDILPEQRELAHKLIDAGADMILGHHPHQFQGIEMYKGKPVVYSMGNFIFDQNDPENKETFILTMKYEGKRLTDFTALPVRTVDKIQVVPLTGEDAGPMLKRQLELCQKLSSRCEIKEDKIVFNLD